MATLFTLIGLLPGLLCELPAIPIKLSKETTYITKPLAGDGLPNYALAIQEIEKKRVTPEKNGAIPLWQAMGQYQMSDEEFERLSREIGLSFDSKVKPFVPLPDESTLQTIVDWLRETEADSDAEDLSILADDYVSWVQSNPWTAKDVPPLAKWLAENDQALDLFVEGSGKQQFYSPYPNLLVDRTVSVLDTHLPHLTGMRTAGSGLMARAMYHVAENDLERAWVDCRSTIALGNHLVSDPLLIDQLVAMSVRRNGLRGVSVILSQPNISYELASKILYDLKNMDRPIDISETYNNGERMMALDFMLRRATDRLGGLPTEEKDEHIHKIVKAGVDLNLSLRWINERYDRMVRAARIKDRKKRVASLGILLEEFEQEAEKLTDMAKLGSLLHTFRSNMIGQICFMYCYPALQMANNKVDEHEQFSMLTMTAAALAVYKAEQGHYPKDLAALMPSFLKEIPSDLYTDKPLRYKPMGDGYLIYSLFENEADDGGTDIYGEIRDGEWQDEEQEVEQDKSDLVIRMPVVARPKP